MVQYKDFEKLRDLIIEVSTNRNSSTDFYNWLNGIGYTLWQHKSLGNILSIVAMQLTMMVIPVFRYLVYILLIYNFMIFKCEVLAFHV